MTILVDKSPLNRKIFDGLKKVGWSIGHEQNSSGRGGHVIGDPGTHVLAIQRGTACGSRIGELENRLQAFGLLASRGGVGLKDCQRQG